MKKPLKLNIGQGTIYFHEVRSSHPPPLPLQLWGTRGLRFPSTDSPQRSHSVDNCRLHFLQLWIQSIHRMDAHNQWGSTTPLQAKLNLKKHNYLPSLISLTSFCILTLSWVLCLAFQLCHGHPPPPTPAPGPGYASTQPQGVCVSQAELLRFLFLTSSFLFIYSPSSQPLLLQNPPSIQTPPHLITLYQDRFFLL